MSDLRFAMSPPHYRTYVQCVLIYSTLRCRSRAAVVFCPECNRKVEDCQHFVQPLNSPAVDVFDPKIKTLAYNLKTRTLEIRFKNGQAWQLFGVPPAVYEELTRQTLSSFLKFIAHRYKPRPVRQPPSVERCPACHREMTERHRTSGKPMR